MLLAFEVVADDQAGAWLVNHPSALTRVIRYDVHRCCGGGKLCRVTVRTVSRAERTADYISASLPDGSEILVDHRAAKRLPARFGLTVRGIGPFKHLDLDLSGEEWGELLYT
jgi:hypothetical protein